MERGQRERERWSVGFALDRFAKEMREKEERKWSLGVVWFKFKIKFLKLWNLPKRWLGLAQGWLADGGVHLAKFENF
jgi:hypothetical protein